MSVWTSWGIIGCTSVAHEVEILDLPDVVNGRDLILYTGSLDEFSNEYHKPFTVHRDGRYIDVGVKE
jgi:hypothetical protein